jgi:hypothetical protein
MALVRDDIMQALARAYCTDANKCKELDVVLLQAMADEIMVVIDRLIEKQYRAGDQVRR